MCKCFYLLYSPPSVQSAKFRELFSGNVSSDKGLNADTFKYINCAAQWKEKRELEKAIDYLTMGSDVSN